MALQNISGGFKGVSGMSYWSLSGGFKSGPGDIRDVLRDSWGFRGL